MGFFVFFRFRAFVVGFPVFNFRHFSLRPVGPTARRGTLVHFRHFFSSFHNLILNAFGFELFGLPFCSLLILKCTNQKPLFPVGISDDIVRKA